MNHFVVLVKIIFLSCRARSRRVKQSDRRARRRGQERHRAGHPHDCSCGRLVVQHRDSPQARHRCIGGIENALRENQKRRQGCVLDISEQEIGDYRPSRPAQPARPRLVLPATRRAAPYRGSRRAARRARTRSSGRVIQAREMPGDDAHCERKQTRERMGEKRPSRRNAVEANTGLEPILQHRSRQSAHQR